MEPKKSNDPDYLGHWRIMGRLGEGGFGTVFLAESGAQKAAIKVIRDAAEVKDEGEDRFKMEITALEKLVDPYIARVIDSDLGAEIPWFATEFINGPTLEAKIKYEGILEERSWFNLAANLFHALTTSHRAGVVHKDVKPSNIILGETGNKLIDFGIAHISGLTRTITFGDFEGSRPYSSPESFTGKSLPEMDVFSAAATLAFAGQGRSIWSGASELQLMRSINEDEPDLTDLTKKQSDFLAPLLNKNPSERPSASEAYEICLEIIAGLDSSEVSPRLLTWAKRKTKNGKRWKLVTGSIMSLVIVGSGLFYVSNNGFSPGDVVTNSSPSSSPTLSPSTTNSSTGVPSVLPSQTKSSTVELTAAQYAKQEACVRISYNQQYKQANPICLEIAKLGDAKSQYALGYNYGQLGNQKESEFWLKKAADQNWPEALAGLGWNEYQAKNYKSAISYATKAANLGSASAMNTLGIIAEVQKRWDDAVSWYKKAWGLKEVWGAINLGDLYNTHFKDNLAAEKWYSAAAKTGDGEAEFAYGEFLRTVFSKNIEACSWFKKSSDHKWNEGVVAYKKYCETADPLPSPSSTKEFTQSAPEAKNVVVKDVFGRVFDAGIDWNVPLTSVASDPVPPITGLQFRLLGYSNKIWLDIAYKLKKTDYGVQAQVDQLVLSMILNKKVCPEFRFVREVKGEITNIWLPGLPECSTDYNP
jgi:serine/threonine protein kinase